MRIGLEEQTLRIIVGVVGGLVVITRLFGVIHPKKVKAVAAQIARWKQGWIRFFYIIISLLGLWILYSSLLVIFKEVPVFLVISFVIGLLFLLSGIFIAHPRWLPQIVRGLVVDRGDFFIRVICFLGVLGGIFILLTAIFGPGWGGGS